MARFIDKLLARPIVYDTFQSMIGARGCHARFMSEMVCAGHGERVLDLGCGVGASVRFLRKDVDYVGIDVSASYIEAARAKYGARGAFICADLSSLDPSSLGRFDRAFSFGVLHHLSDVAATRAVNLVRRVVRPGGLFITIDPCYVPGQPAFAKFLIDNDRGEHVRDQRGFEQLLSGLGPVQSRIFHDLLRIPYTQIVMHVILED